MYMRKKIVELLDKIASSLQDKGLVKEAEELDVISNTIEKEQSDTVQNITKHLERARHLPMRHDPVKTVNQPAQLGSAPQDNPEDIYEVFINGKWEKVQAKNIRVKPTHS
jgi:hypothetical protein